MKNNKGVVIPMVIVFQALFAGALVAAVWHIPAWSKAKHNHVEEAYQAQQMFPQKQVANILVR